MQKILNLIFILALAVIAAIIPLDTALLDINIFKPIVEGDTPVTSPNKIIEEIVISGFEALEFAESGMNPAKIRVNYSSNTGEFGVALPPLTLKFKSAAGDEKNIVLEPSRAEIEIFGNSATYTHDLAELTETLDSGYYDVEAPESGDPSSRYKFIVSKNTKITKRLLKYSSTVPAGQRRVLYFFPDSSYSKAIPVSRLERQGALDYISMYNTLRGGAAQNIGLREKPAVANSGYYWVAGGSVRVDYLSANLRDFSNLDVMYEAVANTFASYGGIQKANFNIDGKAAKTLEIKPAPYIFLPFENDSDYIYIYYEASEANGISELINAFTTRMHEAHILPPMTRLTNCELGENGFLKIEYKDYQFAENREIFEVLLNLTAFSFEKVKELEINGNPVPEILLYNLEQD